MAAEDDIDPLRQCLEQGHDGVGGSAEPCRRLADPGGHDSLIRCETRQHGDGRYPAAFGERSKKVAIVLGDAAAPPESIADQREPGCGARWGAAVLRHARPCSTVRDQRREVSPLSSDRRKVRAALLAAI